MNPLPISILLTAIILIFPVAIFSFLTEDLRKVLIIYYQTACELGIVLTLSWYCMTRWETAKSTIIPLLLVGMICFMIAEVGFNTTFFQKSVEAYRKKAFCAICYSLSFGFIALSLFRYFKIQTEHPLVILGIFSVALVHFSLQYRFLLMPLKDVYFSKLPYFMYVNGVIYSILTAVVAGIAAAYCLRSLNTWEFIFLHLLMALLTFDFAARYQIVESTFDKMTVAQCLWALAIGSIFLTLFLSLIQGKMLFSTEGLLANWFSIRASLALFVFAVAVLLTLAFWIIRYFSIRNAVDVTLILTIILFCWGISNILSFNVSTKVMEIGFLMGANRVSEIGNDGSPELYIQKIQRTIKFSSEINFIIDEYNQMADKFNLRGQKLLESISKRILFEKDALRGQLANQVAHDIESPLGAIRTIMDLPKIDTAQARETLWIALTSITDIVKRLNFRDQDAFSSEQRVYSAAASVEKIFNMKTAEFNGLMTHLKLSVSPAARNSFIQVELDAFRSALSNLINNSKDEIVQKGEPGAISIGLDEVQGSVLISVTDDGILVSDEKLQKINAGTCESTKHLGRPLGIASARDKLNQFDGTISFSRVEPIGLTATIRLPAQMAPEWLASEIPLLTSKILVVFDDDESIHQALKVRLSTDPTLRDIRLISCFNEKELTQLVTSGEVDDALFLVDYELRGTKKVGIDHINRLKLQDKSILMTSHWDEKKIISECRASQVRLLPKSLIHTVKITAGQRSNPDFILVDDNPIVRFAWKSAAESYGLNYRIFSDPAYFQMNKREIATHAALFLDFHLGETTALEILESLNGEFPNYIILTGEDENNIPYSPQLDRNRIIFGKKFPTHLLVRNHLIESPTLFS